MAHVSRRTFVKGVAGMAGAFAIGGCAGSSPPAFSPPVQVFRADRLAQRAGRSYYVLRDGRLVFLETAPRAPVRTLTVLADWRADYARRAAALRR